jgi:hypothetical protein
MDGYKKGGKVKCSPKKKGDKKKVMGTVGEAKALMAALQKARRPATPMPGTRMAGLGMAPPMAPQMAPSDEEWRQSHEEGRWRRCQTA